jgi:LysM repeat protein
MISRGLFGFGMPGNAPVSSPPVVLVTGSSPTLAPIQVSPTPTATSLPTETPFVPLPTDSPTQVSFHGLETPIGTDQNIIIHMVQSGESLVSIASHFWTTTDAIIAVNFQLQLPLQVDKVIVIPNNQTDVQGWPAFEVYNVPEDIVVETLAQQLSVKPDLLKLYNGFSDGEIVRAGDWVLVPHIGTAVP